MMETSRNKMEFETHSLMDIDRQKPASCHVNLENLIFLLMILNIAILRGMFDFLIGSGLPSSFYLPYFETR